MTTTVSIRFWLLCIGMLGGIFFSYYAVFVHGRVGISSDAEGYVAMARSLISGFGFTNPHSPLTSEREPFFPLFLASILSFSGYRLGIALFIQSLVVFAALLWFIKYTTPFLGRFAAGIAAVITAALPGVAATAAGNFLPETLSFIVLLSAFGVFTSITVSSNVWRYALLGFLFGAVGLTRFPLLLLPIFLVSIWFIFRSRVHIPFPSRKMLSFLCIGFFVPILVWTWRNYRVHGIFSPTGTKGGGEFLVRADKTRFAGQDLAAYLFGSAAGDYLARMVYANYAQAIEPYVYGTHVRYAYSAELVASKNPQEVNSRYIEEGLSHIAAHPLRYVANGFAEIFKLNSPMLWHNAADIRHLFADTHPEIPNWVKILFLVMYQGVFYLGIGFVFYIIFTKGFVQPLLFFPMVAVLYVNVMYFFFDSYPRYALPIYPFYVLLAVWGIQHVKSKYQNAK